MHPEVLHSLRLYANRYQSIRPGSIAELDNAAAFWRDYVKQYINTDDQDVLQVMCVMHGLITTTACAILENATDLPHLANALDLFVGALALILINMLPPEERKAVLAS